MTFVRLMSMGGRIRFMNLGMFGDDRDRVTLEDLERHGRGLILDTSGGAVGGMGLPDPDQVRNAGGTRMRAVMFTEAQGAGSLRIHASMSDADRSGSGWPTGSPAGRVNQRQFPREIRGRNLPTPAGILSRPQRREITAALAFRLRAQRSECR